MSGISSYEVLGIPDACFNADGAKTQTAVHATGPRLPRLDTVDGAHQVVAPDDDDGTPDDLYGEGAGGHAGQPTPDASHVSRSWFRGG